MGVYDVMGARFLDKNGLKIKQCTKNALNLVCKIHKYDNFDKNQFSIVELMSRHYLL